MKIYFKTVAIPILIQGIFLLSVIFMDQQFHIYTNTLFYVFIILFYYSKEEYSFKALIDNLKSGNTFWNKVYITMLFCGVGFAISIVLPLILPNLNYSTINIKDSSSVINILIFAISTIILPPLAEEIFYRKNVIVLDKGNVTIVTTTVVSTMLYGANHAITTGGILSFMVIGIPFSIAYIKTQNVYVVMVAHFIINLVGNGMSVITMLGN